MGHAPAPSIATPTPSPSGAQLAHGALPGTKANAAARAGGGISPEFLAGLVSQQAGVPNSGLDILSEIRGSLGGP